LSSPSIRWQGVFWILLSVLSFAGMATMVRSWNHLHPLHVTVSRFVIGALLLAFISYFSRIKIQFNNKRWLLVRGSMGSLASFLFFLTISRIGMGKATFIQYSYPLFASLFSIWILKEFLNWKQWIALSLAITGISVLVNDSLATHLHLNFISDTPYELLALLGAIAAGISVTFGRNGRRVYGG